VKLIDASKLNRLADGFEGAPSEEILVWAREALGPRVAMGTAFGATGMALLDLIQKTVPQMPIFSIDTGFLFGETQDLKARVEARYGIEIEVIHPRLSVAEQDGAYGPALYDRNPDRCCWMRKVEPLQRKLAKLDGWIASLRRDQSASRKEIRVLEPYRVIGGHAMVKVNPMAGWTRKQVGDYLLENEVPYNPLHDQGYPSIGCWPCTRPAAPGADERAGRWAGTSKSECGMHVPLMDVEIPEAEGQLAAG
jgi:phosphoadenosine phosphosulfate reductase